MKNPHEHIPFCQTNSSLAYVCPACKWRLREWAKPPIGRSLDKLLTKSDMVLLKEMLISVSEEDDER